MDFEKFKFYIIDRAQEASTWRGAILVLTSFGVGIRPDLHETIVMLGIGAAGALGAILPDKKEKLGR